MIFSGQDDVVVEDVVEIPSLLDGRQARQLSATINLLERLISLRVAEIDSIIVIASHPAQVGVEPATQLGHSPGCTAVCVLPAKEADTMGTKLLVSLSSSVLLSKTHQAACYFWRPVKDRPSPRPGRRPWPDLGNAPSP